MWSFSADRMFKQCQRQWYYRRILANAKAHDALRHEAYLLSKLQTIAAWRGQLVDQVISTKVVKELNYRQAFDLKAVLTEAKRLFNLQLDFARAHRLREPGLSPAKAGNAFAAFALIEYGETISEEEIKTAWQEIEQAMVNLARMEDLQTILTASPYLIAQRPLHMGAEEMSVRSVPDLIGFNRSGAPIIVDWKVHLFGNADYRLQLALYALCLAACKPHVDFPAWQPRYAAFDVRLLEVQLLTGHVREHGVTQSDLDELEGYVAGSALEMKLACGEGKREHCRPEHFAVTLSPGTCRKCVFRKLCWEESNGTH